jgi:RNA polymerase sigma-70 factor (ECF subfamily)
MQSDAELVKAALDGRREAYDQLVRRHERALLAAAGHVLGDLQQAEDAVQEALVIAYRKLASLRRPGRFGPWALRITRREALRLARRRERSATAIELDEPADHRQDGRIDPDTRHVLAAVMALSAPQRQAVLLRYFGGHSLGEIAAMTGAAVGTVKSRLARAKRRLRETLKED